MQKHVTTIGVALLALSAGIFAQTATTLPSSEQPLGTLGVSVQNEVDAAIDRGLNWLASQQKEDGSWSNGTFPALTALPLWAFANATASASHKDTVEKAVNYILSCVQDDGGIYKVVEGRKGGGLSNYNTAICMTALHALNRPELAPVIRKARTFVADAQHLGGDEYSGGFGYDASTGRAYTDLMNTYYSVQAMRLTQNVEDSRPAGEKHADIDWNAATKYIEKLQAKTASGTNNAGGFTYSPTDAKAGTITNSQGVVFFRAYGSITYAGLLAMVYAHVPADDPRITSALDWTAHHWTLTENPGMGTQGLFFFYHVLTRALATADRDFVPLPDGHVLNWKLDMANNLIAKQKIDPKNGHGYWINDTGRFWENDPVLSTAYCLLALEAL